MFEIGFLKRGKTATQARVGVAVEAQGLLALRVGQPFSPRPVIEHSVFRPRVTEVEWPQTLEELTRELKAEGLPAVVSVHPQLASLLQLALPEVPEAELTSALKFRAREISPIPMEDMVLDYVEIPGMRSRGGERFGYCAVARLSQMRALRDAIRSAGLVLEAIDVKDMVLRHLLARFQGAEDNGLLVFIGEQESRVIVARADRLYLLRSNTMGAQALQQERFDPQEGVAFGRLEGLVLEIQRTLDFYDSHFTDPVPRQIMLAPEWPWMPKLSQTLADQLRLPLRELRLAEAFDGAERLEGCPPDLACLALGAALRPLEGGVKA